VQLFFTMVRPRTLRGHRNSDSSDSFEISTPTTNYTKRTADTSSLTSSETSQLHLPKLPTEDELVLLRRRVEAYERREQKLNKDIVRIKKELDFSKENASRWQQAVHMDVRPGAHYRKEIILLKQKLNQKDDIIQEREITIDNLMAGNHPTHPFLVEHPDNPETSVCSSLLDDIGETPQVREMERLLVENATCIHRLRERDEDVKRLRMKLNQLEQDRIYMKQNEILRTNRNKGINTQTEERRKQPSGSSPIPFDPFHITENQAPDSPLKSADNPSDHSDSVRMTKRVMELHNELGKRTKENDSMRHKLEQSENELKQLRTEFRNPALQSEKIKNMSTELSKSKLALHDAELKSKDYATALNHHKEMIADLKAELKKRDSAIFDLTMKERNETNFSLQQDEIGDLKRALSESLVELENATKVVTEQRQTIHDLKKKLNAKEEDYVQVQRFLGVETENLENVQRELLRKESKINDLCTFKSENEKKLSNEIEHLKNLLRLRDGEMKNLKKNLHLSQEENPNIKKLIEQEPGVGGIKFSPRTVNNTLDVKRNPLAFQDSRMHLQESLKKQNEDLMEKLNLQSIQLHTTDKILVEKEQEKARLKSSLDRLRSKLNTFEADKFALEMRITKEKDEIISDLNTMRGELKSSLKKKASDHDAIMEDLQVLKRHIKVNARESTDLRARVNPITDNFSSQYDQRFSETIGKGIDMGDSKIEFRARRNNHSVEESKLKGLEELSSSDECQSLVSKLESTSQSLHQMNIHIREKNCIIARLLHSIEESRQCLYNERAWHGHLQEQLIIKDEQIAELQAAENLKNDVVRTPFTDKTDLHEEKIELLSKEKENLADSLYAAQNALRVKANTISNLESQLETIFADMKDQRCEKEVLFEKYSQLDERNRIVEQKLDVSRKNADVYANETRHLQEEIVRTNCEIEPLKKYVTTLLDLINDGGNDAAAEKTLIHGLKKTRLELVTELNSLLENSQAVHEREKELDERTNEIAILKRTIVEVKENVTETKYFRDRTENINEKDPPLDKVSMRALSYEKLVADLQKEIRRSRCLMAENSELKKENGFITEQFEEISIEVQELSKKLANLTTANEKISSLKKELEAAKESENEKVTSYERQISALTMNKDVTIDTLRKDLAASRSRSAEEVARLTSDLSKLQQSKTSNEDMMRQKAERVRELERTLHAQEKTVESLGSELSQAKINMRNMSEQRRIELEELQKELIESKSRAMNQDREYTSLTVKLDECKLEHEKEIKSLGDEIERLKKDSVLSKAVKELQGNNLMLEAKQRLEQLKLVNMELREDNIEMAAKLEKAFAKIRGLEEETQIGSEMEGEYNNLRQQLKDLEGLLEDNARIKSQRSKSSAKNRKSRGTGEGSKTKLLGWGKKNKMPSVLIIDANQTQDKEQD